MSLPYNLVLASCGIFAVFHLCKWITIKLQIVRRLRGLSNYLSNVLDISKRNVSHQQPTPLVTHLNNYSQKMKSWYEQSIEDESESENESQQKFPSSQRKNQSKNMRSVGLQTSKCSSDLVGKNESSSLKTRWDHLNSHGKENSCDLSTIRQIQQNQLKMLLRQVRYWGERDLKAPLIICVEANGTNISGYLLNLKQRVCKFYVFGIRRLPWKLETSQGDWDNTEFKMKNVLFALLLWQQEILMMKKFSLFVNCWAVNHPDCSFGKIATDFLEHFTSCENVIRVNSNAQVNRFTDTEVFAKLIQPARELMCWNLSRFRTFMRNAYGILDFEGSHSFMDDYQQSAKDDGYFAKTYRYDYFLSKVNKNAEKWAKGCTKCDHEKFSNSLDFKTELESSESDPGIMPYPLTDNYW